MDINDTALRYIENRAHTKKEMKDHLLKKGFAEADADDAVKRLSDVRYLDDVSYSAQFLKYGFGKGWSVNRVKQELRKRGVADNDIAQGIYVYEDEYETDVESGEAERAYAQAEKFMKTAETADQKTMGRLGRRLAGFGYAPGVVYKTVGAVMEKYQKDDEDEQ
ncbi:MAG: recombination regulator RecX [Eubacteriaceae bacterium]|jgi:SOS response regulatory protein OraA/RecX|nr:recombination regulator RecX [Eubacteriaceae bacterium]